MAPFTFLCFFNFHVRFVPKMSPHRACLCPQWSVRRPLRRSPERLRDPVHILIFRDLPVVVRIQALLHERWDHALRQDVLPVWIHRVHAFQASSAAVWSPFLILAMSSGKWTGGFPPEDACDPILVQREDKSVDWNCCPNKQMTRATLEP